MWDPVDMKRATLTKLAKVELFLCLGYLCDMELRELSTTCSWFREAFFALTRTGGNRILSIASKKRNYRFSSLTKLWIRNDDWTDYWTSFRIPSLRWIRSDRLLEVMLSRVDFKYQFPQLSELCMSRMMINILTLPKIESVTELFCSNCRLYLDSSIDKPFPKLKKLVMNSSDLLHKDVAAGGLERLVLKYPESFIRLTPQPLLSHLEIRGMGDKREWLLRELTRLFPNLKHLSLGTNDYDSVVNLKEMSPHPSLTEM